VLSVVQSVVAADISQHPADRPDIIVARTYLADNGPCTTQAGFNRSHLGHANIAPSRTSSDWRLQLILRITDATWLRIVRSDTPDLAAYSFTV
jgi:hypothetical protein